MIHKEEQEYSDEMFQDVCINNGPKAGRNDPCPCGSGKKFKKCCLFGDRKIEKSKQPQKVKMYSEIDYGEPNIDEAVA